MNLTELLKMLDQYGVRLSLLPSGKLKPTADQQPPAELVDGIREHKKVLMLRLERGQRADGRYYLEDLVQRTGICASCTNWKASAGALMGKCLLAGSLAIHAAHRCPEDVQSWRGRRVVTMLPLSPAVEARL